MGRRRPWSVVRARVGAGPGLRCVLAGVCRRPHHRPRPACWCVQTPASTQARPLACPRRRRPAPLRLRPSGWATAVARARGPGAVRVVGGGGWVVDWVVMWGLAVGGQVHLPVDLLRRLRGGAGARRPRPAPRGCPDRAVEGWAGRCAGRGAEGARAVGGKVSGDGGGAWDAVKLTLPGCWLCLSFRGH